VKATLEEIDVLRDVERGGVPAHILRRDKLVALRAEAIAMVRELGLARGRASWRILPLEGEPEDGWLYVDGQRLQAPRLLPASGQLTGLACAAATLGADLERQVAHLFGQRRVSLALALDGVSNEMLFALSRRTQDRILATARRQGLTVAGELRAGDPGLDLRAQQTVLDLAGAGELGLGLTRTLMMNPAKSTSFVLGVGLQLPLQTWSRCDGCASRKRCTLAAGAR